VIRSALTFKVNVKVHIAGSIEYLLGCLIIILVDSRHWHVHWLAGSRFISAARAVSAGAICVPYVVLISESNCHLARSFVVIILDGSPSLLIITLPTAIFFG
jgi:hypothetical protein